MAEKPKAAGEQSEVTAKEGQKKPNTTHSKQRQAAKPASQGQKNKGDGKNASDGQKNEGKKKKKKKKTYEEQKAEMVMKQKDAANQPPFAYLPCPHLLYNPKANRDNIKSQKKYTDILAIPAGVGAPWYVPPKKFADRAKEEEEEREKERKQIKKELKKKEKERKAAEKGRCKCKENEEKKDREKKENKA